MVFTWELGTIYQEKKLSYFHFHKYNFHITHRNISQFIKRILSYYFIQLFPSRVIGRPTYFLMKSRSPNSKGQIHDLKKKSIVKQGNTGVGVFLWYGIQKVSTHKKPALCANSQVFIHRIWWRSIEAWENISPQVHEFESNF